MAARNRLNGFTRPSKIVVAILLALVLQQRILPSDGQPIAIRYWPGNCVSIETMWNFQVAFGVDAHSRALMPRPADVEFVDDFWAASGSNKLILDRKPNETKAVLKPASENSGPSGNAMTFSQVVLTDASAKKSISVNVIEVDGVTIVDSNKNSAHQWVTILRDVKELPQVMRTIDAVLIDDVSADAVTYQSLQRLLKARVMVLRNSVPLETIGDTSVSLVPHNALAISKAAPTDKTTWVKLGETAWKMEPGLTELFRKKEAASQSSRAVFAALSLNQMNFRPSNGTHTPRWNAEHMMGRELLFFSQIYHAVDANIPIMDLNPKQMPPDYRPAHANWTGSEESLQMERVEAFTRRFAYLLDGMDLNKTAKGSTFWTPRSLLKQMENHYTEHTANVVKKRDLPDWPGERNSIRPTQR